MRNTAAVAAGQPRSSHLIRRWRQQRRWSQLDLACEAEISTRHLSFLETGAPGRAARCCCGWPSSSSLPLRERNVLLVAAGFAPGFRERALDDPSRPRAPGDRAHPRRERAEPDLAVDRHWDLVTANAPAMHLLSGLDPALLGPKGQRAAREPGPARARAAVVNYGEWRAHCCIACAGRSRPGRCRPGRAARRIRSACRPWSRTRLRARTPSADALSGVAVPMQLHTPLGTLSFLSTTMVFGTAVDVTLSRARHRVALPRRRRNGARARAARRDAVSERRFALFETPIGRARSPGRGRCRRRTVARSRSGADAPARAAPVRRRQRSLAAGDVRRAIDEIVALLSGTPAELGSVTLDMEGIGAFERLVYDAARRIAPGRTQTYGEIAAGLATRRWRAPSAGAGTEPVCDRRSVPPGAGSRRTDWRFLCRRRYDHQTAPAAHRRCPGGKRTRPVRPRLTGAVNPGSPFGVICLCDAALSRWTGSYASSCRAAWRWPRRRPSRDGRAGSVGLCRRTGYGGGWVGARTYLQALLRRVLSSVGRAGWGWRYGYPAYGYPAYGYPGWGWGFGYGGLGIATTPAWGWPTYYAAPSWVPQGRGGARALGVAVDFRRRCRRACHTSACAAPAAPQVAPQQPSYWYYCTGRRATTLREPVLAALDRGPADFEMTPKAARIALACCSLALLAGAWPCHRGRRWPWCPDPESRPSSTTPTRAAASGRRCGHRRADPERPGQCRGDDGRERCARRRGRRVVRRGDRQRRRRRGLGRRQRHADRRGVGGQRGRARRRGLQRQYDAIYVQCMANLGNAVPGRVAHRYPPRHLGVAAGSAAPSGRFDVPPNALTPPPGTPPPQGYSTSPG